MPDESRYTIAALLADPDAQLALMRAEGPLVDMAERVFVVHYGAVRKMLQDGRMTANFPKTLEFFGITGGAFYDFMARSPLNMDGERHRAWRKRMVQTFTPRNVDQLRPFLRAESERLVALFADQGTCEFMEDFARQLPALGLCELIGVPKEDRTRFCTWADTIGLGFNPITLSDRIKDVDAAMEALLVYARELVASRQAAPQDDLVSRLSRGALTGEAEFDREAIARTVAGLVFAGHETTKNQLGWMMTVLSAVPAQWDQIAAEPNRLGPSVEEILRLRSAAANVSRTVREDMAWEGRTLSAGTRLVSSIWSANRDASVFSNPDAFQPERDEKAPQIAFGQGAHHCLGAALARAELQEALSVLSSTLTCPTLLPGSAYLPPLGITGPTRLPIAFKKRV